MQVDMKFWIRLGLIFLDWFGNENESGKRIAFLGYLLSLGAPKGTTWDTRCFQDDMKTKEKFLRS